LGVNKFLSSIPYGEVRIFVFWQINKILTLNSEKKVKFWL
jgi:hypothetical protein